MEIKAFFDHDTSTLTYIVSDPSTKKTAIIDPVLDYDPKASRTTKDASSSARSRQSADMPSRQA